jgi:two-component system response regulator DegU
VQNHEQDNLSQRELGILEWMMKDHTNQQISEQLCVTKKTVDFHIGNILEKMGVENRVQAVVEAIRRGWVEV